jgi:hypothetical protein
MTAHPKRPRGPEGEGEMMLTRNAQRHAAEYDRLVALRIEAGPSNPQQRYVGTKRAKVQIKFVD